MKSSSGSKVFLGLVFLSLIPLANILHLKGGSIFEIILEMYILRLKFWGILALGWVSGGVLSAAVAPSTLPPGGLAPSNTPQIVLLTVDDSVTTNSFRLVQGILTNHVNPNGHPIKATFFVSLDSKVDYGLVNRLYGAGHEIAIHTMTHSTSTNTDLDSWRREIVGCRKALSRFAAIPEIDIVGFRAPYLKFNNQSFQILAEQGLRYDSSLEEWPGSYSTNASQYLWPYTLENGVVQSNRTGAFPIQPVPGVFEIPLWNQVTSGVSAVSMDPPAAMDSNTVTDLWRTNFLQHYEGNRAPYGIFLHATTTSQWLSDTSKIWQSVVLNDFIEWALDHSNVWFLSERNLADFMETPVSASQASTADAFQTVTRTPYPTNLVKRCIYPSSSVFSINVCGDCPPVYPSPTNMYSEAAPIPGGVLSFTMNTNDSNHVIYFLSYSNDTSESAVNWHASFTFPTNIVFINSSSSSCSVETNGNVIWVTVSPNMSFLPLLSGQLMTNVSFAVRGLASTNGEVFSSTLYGLRPVKPTLLQVLPVSDGGLQIRWDDSAYGYAPEFSTNIMADQWQSVSNLYGTNIWQWVPPASLPRGFLRVRGLP